MIAGRKLIPLKLFGPLIILLVSALAVSAISFAVSANDVLGIWTAGNGDARIEIFKKEGKYFGKIVWLREPIDPDTQKPKLDKKNPEASKRSKPVMGMELLKGFEWDTDDKEWNNGTIYDPKSGKTYSCYLTLKDQNTLDVRGYVGFSWIGRTDTWKRYK